MIAPLFDAPASVLAIPVGVAFGATLERAGLGSARTIADQLTARDFTVLKVMFSAIVTAMLGIFWASRLGWLDLSRVAIPQTDIVPRIVGAVLFGAGFAIASLCPGTACVSAATGTRDGLAAIGGLIAGTLVTSLFWTQLGIVAERAPRDGATLPPDIGVSPGIVVAIITVIALVAIPATDRIAARRTSGGAMPRTRLRVSPLAAVALSLAILAVASGSGAPATSAASPRDVAAGSDGVDALVLAQWIRDRKAGLRVIDVREGLAPDDYGIPGAEVVPLRQLPNLAVRGGETSVLYGDSGRDAAPALAMLRGRGVRDAFVLRAGLAGWENEVLAPRLPDPADTAAVRRFQAVRDLAAWFGGRPSADPKAGQPATAGTRRRRSC